MAPVLQQFANIPNGVFPIDSNGILIIRDYAENVKRMLEFITKVDVIVPEEFVSEVIPIKYAMVDDIANALNSLGGSSSSIGNATTPSGGGRLGGGGGAGNQFQPGGAVVLTSPVRGEPLDRPRAEPAVRATPSASDCSPSFNGPRRAGARTSSNCSGQPKSSPTSGPIPCWFMPRSRT